MGVVDLLPQWWHSILAMLSLHTTNPSGVSPNAKGVRDVRAKAGGTS